MAIGVTVEIPRNTSLRIARLLDPKRMAFAEAQAINRTTGNIATFGLQLVSEEMGIPKSKLLRRGRKLFFSPSTDEKYGRVSKGRKATVRRLLSEVQFAGRPFNIVRFDGKLTYGKNGRSNGVTFNAWEGQQTTKGPIWQLKNKPGRPIVIKKGDTFRSFYGPGVRDVAKLPKIQRQLEGEALRRFDEHFASAVQFAYGRGFNTALLGGGRRRR